MAVQENVELRSDRLTASVATFGAQLHSLATTSGHDILWHGDPAVWPEHAPILFPLIGPLRDHQLRHKGETYHMPDHGFAQHRRFEIREQSGDHCLLVTADDAETRTMYPFSFRLEVEYWLQDRSISHTMRVLNTGDETLPFDVGFHPGFQWPLGPGVPKEDHRIVFERPEPAPIRRGVDDPIFLYPDGRPTPIHGDTLNLRDELFDDQAIVLDHPNSRSVTYGARTGPQLRIDFPDCPYLAVWMRPGATFIAIEPWQGLPAEVDFDGEFSEKPGIAHLEAGASRSWGIAITLEE